MSLSEFDIQISQEFPFSKIIGVDEAGRGPLAGPVTAAACYIPPELYSHPVMAKINDSKKLSPAKREKIFEELLTLPILWRTGYASAAEIDKHNILQATFIAMRRALAFFEKENALVLVDGNRLIPFVHHQQKSIIGGDAKSLCVAAASIIAKVSRDRFMDVLDEKFPLYDFSGHKGYGTKSHIASVKEYGPCPQHRMTFEPLLSMYGGLFSENKNV